MVAEFDLMFDGAGGAAAQMYVTSKTSLGKGKMEVKSQTDDGETVVQFTDWQGAPMGNNPGWGVYKLKEGSSQEFMVIELAASKDEIKELDDGLKQGNEYFTGVSCMDKEHCDFSKAMPQMETKPHQYYEFLYEQFV